jgi:hypothetical protein
VEAAASAEAANALSAEVAQLAEQVAAAAEGESLVTDLLELLLLLLLLRLLLLLLVVVPPMRRR